MLIKTMKQEKKKQTIFHSTNKESHFQKTKTLLPVVASMLGKIQNKEEQEQETEK
jgi:hypothetical protein